MANMCDLPRELVENILTRIQITSLRAVRCTCKLWRSISEELLLGEAAARQQFVGFMSMANKLCSVRFDLRGIGTEDEVVEQSVKQVALFDHVEISNVFQLDGLVLLVTKDSLILWNPYLQQQRSIGPRTSFHETDDYAIGYDNNGNHKILRLSHAHEIYDLNSNMWTVLNVILDWRISYITQSVTLKGNSYFFASKLFDQDMGGAQYEACLVCFDFTKEEFGNPLEIPFRYGYTGEGTVALSRVSEERLAILHQAKVYEDLNIYLTYKIDPNEVSWTFFFTVNMAPQIAFAICPEVSFFIDEEKNVAVVLNLYMNSSCAIIPTAFIIRKDIKRKYGCFKAVTIGDALPAISRGLCVSPYLPSLLQIKHKSKRKRQNKIDV